MSKEKLGQEPAFSCVTGEKSNGYLQEGMSKRFYAACAAMQGLLANKEFLSESAYISASKDNEVEEWICKASYELADELLKQENE